MSTSLTLSTSSTLPTLRRQGVVSKRRHCKRRHRERDRRIVRAAKRPPVFLSTSLTLSTLSTLPTLATLPTLPTLRSPSAVLPLGDCRDGGRESERRQTGAPTGLRAQHCSGADRLIVPRSYTSNATTNTRAAKSTQPRTTRRERRTWRRRRSSSTSSRRR